MSANSLSPAPIRTPLIDDQGMISTQWIKWIMIELFRRVGGGTAMSNDDLEKLASSAQGQSSSVANALASSISSILNQSGHSSPEIAKLREDVAALKNTAGFPVQEIARLRSEIDGLKQAFKNEPRKAEIPPAHARSPIDPTALHKLGREVVSGRKRFDTPIDFAQPSGDFADRQWSVTVNQTNAGTIAFYYSSSISNTANTASAPALEIGTDYVGLPYGTNITFVSSQIGTDASGELGFWGVTPVTQPTALSAYLSDVSATSTSTSPWGYSTQAEADSIVTLLNNLNLRVYELETKLTALGLLGA